METKTCSKCKQPKALNQFHNHIRKKDKKATKCKSCNNYYEKKLTPEKCAEATDFVKQTGEWKQVKDFEQYLIFKDGRLWNVNTQRFLKPKTMPGRYQDVKLQSKESHRYTTFHRLLAEAFIPNPFNLPQVNHLDGNKQNNILSNLEWVTAQENAQHALAAGLKVAPKGEEFSGSKLTEIEVIQIRSEYIPRVVSRAKLAEKYQVSQGTIQCILERKTWKHVA
jgi:hypothetical protein